MMDFFEFLIIYLFSCFFGSLFMLANLTYDNLKIIEILCKIFNITNKVKKTKKKNSKMCAGLKKLSSASMQNKIKLKNQLINYHLIIFIII